MNKLKKILFILILFVIICQFFALPAAAVDGTPKLVILSPPDGIYTNVSSILITGESEHGAVLTINGTNIPNNNGSFSWNLSLEEGEAYIEVLATDPAGNTGRARVNITVDFTPPPIEVTRPDFNQTIQTRYLNMEGMTENGSAVSVNGIQIVNDNGTWSIPLVLSGVNNVFNIESTDKAGNKARKTIKIKLGTNLLEANLLLNFSNLTLNFNPLGRFEGENDAVSGKYVSYIFNINESTFSDYSLNDTVWFNRITISGFTPGNTSISGPVARYRQEGEFGQKHSIEVEIHDNRMGTMLLDIRQFEDIYGKIRDYLAGKPRQRLLINVSRDGNVTLDADESGNQAAYYINETWKDWPEVTFELANDVTASVISNGYKFEKDEKEAYLFRANYAGGSSDFTLVENSLAARVNNSLLIFRQFPDMNLTDADILDRLISQAISDGIIGAEFFIDDFSSYDYVTFGNFNISVSFPDFNTMELNISSSSHNGTVLAVGMAGNFYEKMITNNLNLKYDGTEIHHANSYQDIMDVNDDMGHAEYLLAAGTNGAIVLISIPGFSSHIISFEFEQLPGIFGSSILDLLNFLSSLLFMFLPGTSWEMVFGIWWLAIVSIIYIVVRKAFRRNK
jgi:hypothetical protein